MAETESCKAGLEPAYGASPIHLVNELWRDRTVEELAAEQGVTPVVKLESILGHGADLWDSDDDFEAFVSGIDRRRGEDRS